MILVAAFATAALLLCAVALFIQRSLQQAGRARLEQLELRPNCLLTRYPIVFLAAQSSLFRMFEHWNELPAFLREHGYEVYVLQPLARTASEITSALREVGEPCHVIADTSFARELSELADFEEAPLVTITRVQVGEDPALERKAYRPHRLPIEVFTPAANAPAEALGGWRTRAAKALLTAYNWRRSPRINGSETGDFARTPSWSFEEQFLDYAIQLAERDCART